MVGGLHGGRGLHGGIVPGQWRGISKHGVPIDRSGRDFEGSMFPQIDENPPRTGPAKHFLVRRTANQALSDARVATNLADPGAENDFLTRDGGHSIGDFVLPNDPTHSTTQRRRSVPAGRRVVVAGCPQCPL